MRSIIFIIISLCFCWQLSAQTSSPDSLQIEDELLKTKIHFYFGVGKFSTKYDPVENGEVLTFHFQKHILPHLDFGPQAVYYFRVDSMNETGIFRLGLDFKYNFRDKIKKSDLFLLGGLDVITSGTAKTHPALYFGIGLESRAYNRIKIFGLFEQIRSLSLKDNYYNSISFGIKILNPMLTKDD